MTVRWVPDTIGSLDGSLTVSSSAANSPHTVSLTGISTPVDFSSLMAGYTANTFAFARFHSWTAVLGETWYWSSPNASTNGAPVGVSEFRRTVEISGNQPVVAHIYGAVDNLLRTIRVNGTLVRTYTDDTFEFRRAAISDPFVLQPGTNVVAVTVENLGTSTSLAGFAFQIRKHASPNTVLAPVSGWKFKP
jgi:hypothetical protein